MDHTHQKHDESKIGVAMSRLMHTAGTVSQGRMRIGGFLLWKDVLSGEDAQIPLFLFI
jgi:hypothetical protein